MRRLAGIGLLVLVAAAACASNTVVPVGGGCSSDDVCLTGFCIPEADASGRATGWAGGYCSGNCEKSPCPQGRCLALAGKTYCVADCAADLDCRKGYVCDRYASACLPDCRLGWSCGDALACDPSNGNCQLPQATAELDEAAAAPLAWPLLPSNPASIPRKPATCRFCGLVCKVRRD